MENSRLRDGENVQVSISFLFWIQIKEWGAHNVSKMLNKTFSAKQVGKWKLW